MSRTSTLFTLLLAVFFSLASAASAVPSKHDAWYKSSKAYQTMYDGFEAELIEMDNYMEGYPAFEQLLKENEKLLAQCEKPAPAGQDAASACARVLGDCIVNMHKRQAAFYRENTGGTPGALEGVYRLQAGQGRGGCLCINADEDGCWLEINVWSDDMTLFGKATAKAKKGKAAFATTSVYDPAKNEDTTAGDVQLHIAVKDGAVTIETTDAFKKGGFVSFRADPEGERTIVPLDVSGTYKRVK